MRKPRAYYHPYIYVDERKEKLQKIEERAKREAGLLPEEGFNPERIRGTFVEGTSHLKRRKESASKPLSYGVLILCIAGLLFVLHYLVTGTWNF